MTILPFDTITALSSCTEEIADSLNETKKLGLRVLTEDAFLEWVKETKKNAKSLDLSDVSPKVATELTDFITKINNFTNDVYILFSLAKQELKK